MFEGWSEFYLMAGGAAAVLIGLIFVVVTLMQDRSRDSVIAGSKLYMGPIVLSVSFVLVLSAAALTPGINFGEMAVIAGIVALWGLARGIRSIVGINGLRGGEDAPHWTDVWFYGVIPAGLFLCLAAVAMAFWMVWPGAGKGLAVVLTSILLLAVRNEWDLVTWLAPKPDRAEEKEFPSH